MRTIWAPNARIMSCQFKSLNVHMNIRISHADSKAQQSSASSKPPSKFDYPLLEQIAGQILSLLPGCRTLHSNVLTAHRELEAITAIFVSVLLVLVLNATAQPPPSAVPPLAWGPLSASAPRGGGPQEGHNMEAQVS